MFSTLTIHLASGFAFPQADIWRLHDRALPFLPVFRSRIWMRGGYFNALLCSCISGICNGLFGIGGPLMARYFLFSTDGKESYIAQIQCLFLITGAVNMFTRIRLGLYSVKLLPYTLAGMAGIFIGKTVGLRMLDRIDAETVKKAAAILIGISGIVTILQL